MHFELVLSNILMFNARAILEISYIPTLMHSIHGYIYTPGNRLITEHLITLRFAKTQI